MGKTRDHEIEELSDQFLERFFVKCIHNKLHNDYGLDYQIELTDNGNPTGIIFFVQNKGTDSLDISEEFINFDFETKYLKNYLDNQNPVLLFRYDTKNDISYWINTQKYVRETLDKDKPNWVNQKKVRLKIPIKNVVNDINTIIDEIIQAKKENIRFFVKKLKWYEGQENILRDIEDLEENLKSQQEEVDIKHLHASLVYYRKNQPDSGKKHLEEMYKQGKETKETLNAIIGLLSIEAFRDECTGKINAYSKKGKEIAMKLKLKYYEIVCVFYLELLSFYKLAIAKLPLTVIRLIRKPADAVTDIVKFYRNNLERSLSDQLNKSYTILSKILERLLSEKKYNDYFHLLFKLIYVENIIDYAYVRGVNKKIIQEELEKQQEFLQIILNLIESLKYNDLYLYGVLQIGGRYEIFDIEKAKKVYKLGLKHAKNTNHMFYISKFTSLLQNFGSKEEILSYEDMKYQPLSLFAKTIRSAWKNKQKDSSIKIALRDLDPSLYLKKCEFLKIAYYPSIMGEIQYLYSLGPKTIHCAKQEYHVKGLDLKENFNYYWKEYCTNCSHRTPREKDWVLTFKQLEKMSSGKS